MLLVLKEAKLSLADDMIYVENPKECTNKIALINKFSSARLQDIKINV